MRKLLTASALALAAAALALAPAALASPSQDQAYVSCVGNNVFSSGGPGELAAFGHRLAVDVASGVAAGDEQSWVYYNTNDSVTRAQSNILVNCATHVWLGYSGPNG